MKNSIFTKHASIRVQQRGVNREIVGLLLKVGRKTHCGAGSLRYTFTPAARRRLKNIIPAKRYAQIESKLNSFAVVSSTGEIITVGHQFKRVWH